MKTEVIKWSLGVEEQCSWLSLNTGNGWIMLLFITVTLWVCTTLANESPTPVYNRYPCMQSDNAQAYISFLSKHVRADAPKTLGQNEWQAFIQQIETCDRLVQSFLPFSDKHRVDNVCSSSGGKTHHDNMCISTQEFGFTTVHLGNNCIVKQVTPERKHIILACDEVKGDCLPVHFKANRNNVKPKPKSPDCKNPKYRNHTEFAYQLQAFSH
ncbi:hypothetical protein AOLI_G00041730 [Acnodon oligacanthus]